MQNKRSNALVTSVTLAMLVAISIISGKYLAIRGGEILRFSFENLPIILAGIAFGPISGALTGIVADLVGCVMVGYAINPIVTVGAAAVGFFAGVSFDLLKKASLANNFSIVLTVAVSHIIGSVLIKTYGLAIFYEMPVWMLMLWRLLNYVIVGAVEAFILIVLLKNKEISSKFMNKQRRKNK